MADPFWRNIALQHLPETIAELRSRLEIAQTAILETYTLDTERRFAAIRDASQEIAYAQGALRYLADRFSEPEQLALPLTQTEA